MTFEKCQWLSSFGDYSFHVCLPHNTKDLREPERGLFAYSCIPIAWHSSQFIVSDHLCCCQWMNLGNIFHLCSNTLLRQRYHSHFIKEDPEVQRADDFPISSWSPGPVLIWTASYSGPISSWSPGPVLIWTASYSGMLWVVPAATPMTCVSRQKERFQEGQQRCQQALMSLPGSAWILWLETVGCLWFGKHQHSLQKGISWGGGGQVWWRRLDRMQVTCAADKTLDHTSAVFLLFLHVEINPEL